MSAFKLYDGAGTKYLDVQHVHTDADQFDEIRATVTNPSWTSLGSAASSFPRGDSSPAGNFALTEISSRWGNGGQVLADLLYKGVFAQKWRVEYDLQTEAWSSTNVKIPVLDPDVFWARAEILVAAPTVTLYAVDENPPETAAIGRPAGPNMYLGGALPTKPLNPFTTLTDGTVHYPFDWVLIGCPGEQNYPGTPSVWRKEFRYVFRHKFTP